MSKTGTYTCRQCEGTFDEPQSVGDPAGSVCSPCCLFHFVDEDSTKRNRPCAVACCAEVDPQDAKAAGYQGTDLFHSPEVTR
jgi:hypothetical protein